MTKKTKPKTDFPTPETTLTGILYGAGRIIDAGLRGSGRLIKDGSIEAGRLSFEAGSRLSTLIDERNEDNPRKGTLIKAGIASALLAALTYGGCALLPEDTNSDSIRYHNIGSQSEYNDSLEDITYLLQNT